MPQNTFVISPCFFKNIKNDHSSYQALYVFPTKERLRVGVDRNNKLYSLYEKIIIENNDQILKGWLELMAKTSKFDSLGNTEESPLDEKELCLYICKYIRQGKKPLVVWDRNEYNHSFNDDYEMEYEQYLIWFINRHELKDALEDPQIVNNGTMINGNVENNGIMINGNVENTKLNNKVKRR
ncbi:MAG: hypothetical protein LBR60_08605 [Fibrobacter sp.]|jgi:hypothetical protein|nr:hypothetical protein [Fibrobacter sp.]